MTPLDPTDVRILEILQRDGSISNQDLAARVNLSPSPCWRRVRRLEDEGVIEKYVTLLSPQAVGLLITAYSHIALENQRPTSVKEFDTFVQERPEILECSMVSGNFDYLLRVATANMDAYEHFLSNHLLPLPSVRSASTSFVMRQNKHTTSLYLGNLCQT